MGRAPPLKNRTNVGFALGRLIRLISKNKTEAFLICSLIILLTFLIRTEVTSYHRASKVKIRHLANTNEGFQSTSFPEHSTSAAVVVSDPLVVEPDLLVFLQRVRVALSPFTNRYVKTISIDPLSLDTTRVCQVLWSSAKENVALFQTCRGACETRDTLLDAKALCESTRGCVGVTQLVSTAQFQIRLGTSPEDVVALVPSRGERSWQFLGSVCPEDDDVKEERSSNALAVWNVFHDVVEGSLEDRSLHLLDHLFDAREDGSIFISISSYRDNTCADTLRKAFERAKFPDLLSAGIVQQNCVHPTKCHTGTGWGNTRQWVQSKHPDVDCVSDFCASELGSRHCQQGRIRILRLDEIDSYGPFFSRFVNSKLWRGENFYLQIDAHTDFRSEWDVSMVAQMRNTPSYPKSVISNYPLSGTPNDKHAWEKLKNPLVELNEGIPSALCGCTFEHAGASHYTVRLGQTGRQFTQDRDQVKRSLFVAAGFFIAHGQFVNEVGFDPFLPFLFMGEEIALSIRFYTNGYNIYAPSADVLRHEYVRKESPKFWESVGHTYSHGNIHNELTDIIVQRVQYLVTFPEADSPAKISPSNLLTRMDGEFGLGTRRTAAQFLEISGMDLKNHRQRTPDWCRNGQSPPE